MGEAQSCLACDSKRSAGAREVRSEVSKAVPTANFSRCVLVPSGPGSVIPRNTVLAKYWQHVAIPAGCMPDCAMGVGWMQATLTKSSRIFLPEPPRPVCPFFLQCLAWLPETSVVEGVLYCDAPPLFVATCHENSEISVWCRQPPT